ncbi:MAG: PHP domain-containing protein [Candidatus Brockarchaeota archaeon]|nr:PHP domain-containing protein [Candidatus Brockarchaeota archaeon]
MGEASYDLHVHSAFSGDSLLRPETIVKVAKKAGLDGIAVTDHETVEGGLRTRGLAPDGLSIIVGYETKIEGRDVICLFVEEKAKASDMAELREKTKEKGGITVLAHPYRMFAPKIVAEEIEVDAVEVYNSRLSRGRNRKGEELADRLGKPKVAGSDAHVACEIGRAYTVIEVGCEPREAILRGLAKPFGTSSPLWVRPASLLSHAVAATIGTLGVGRHGR